MNGEFSVWQFFPYGTHECVRRKVAAEEAVEAFRHYNDLRRGQARHHGARDHHRRRRLHECGMGIRKGDYVSDGGGRPMKRLAPLTWTRKIIHAASMRVGMCQDSGGMVGITFLAQDGTEFAHGHFDIEIAERFVEAMRNAIDEARAKAVN